MDILILNSGSSSLKYQYMNSVSGKVYGKGLIERIGIEGSNIQHKKGDEEKVIIERDLPSHKEAVELLFEVLQHEDYGIIDNVDDIQAIGHRIVHGGSIIQPQLVDDKALETLEDAIRFAPLHNPGAIQGILGVQAVVPGKPNVICVDTGFHASIPEENSVYAIPYEYYEKDKIKRYGAHGTSHKYITLQVAEKLGKKPEEVNIITCHLGNGSSITAVKNGKSYDTSMGLTPLEGLVMGTRSGDIDPAVIFVLGKQYNMSYEEMDTLLNKKSGLLGLSGVSSDFRDVTIASKEGNERAKLTIDVFANRAKKYIGAYMALLGKVDAIAFAGGIGENSDFARKIILDGLEELGVKLDESKNSGAREEKEISADDSKVKIFIVPTNEELMIARETQNIVENL
ncbi:acetate/propionate family kinase [Helcococcus kunzii]|uniref:acetate/propionate family kinase n=1 Tax=Helcococcus kunzii TaxID=40091 RepID=UPI001BB00481|nr:acetate kinase [Helcococcus kunzii]QUY64799.1 acetate kinase [Helcococcus kunzii]